MVVRVDAASMHAAADALEASAARLSAATPTAVVSPAGGDNISGTGAALINARSAHVASAVTAAAAVAVGAAAALRASAEDYSTTDTSNAAAFAATRSGAAATAALHGGGSGAAADVPGIVGDRRSGLGVPSSIGADPLTVATVLRAGDQGASAAAHSQAWTGLAAALVGESDAVSTVAAGLRGAWDSPTAEQAVARVAGLGRWLTDAAGHATAVAESSAAHARDHAAAVAAHPAPAEIVAVRSAVATNSGLVTAGDAAAVPALHASRQQWSRLIADSSAAQTQFGASTTQSTATTGEVSAPPPVAADGSPVKEKPGDKKDPGKKDGDKKDGAVGDRSGDEGTDSDSAPGADSSDDAALTAGDPGVRADARALADQQLAAQSMQQGVTQASQFGQQAAQTGFQQATQMMSMGSQLLQSMMAPMSSLASSAMNAPMTALGDGTTGIDSSLGDPALVGAADAGGVGSGGGFSGGGADISGGAGSGDAEDSAGEGGVVATHPAGLTPSAGPVVPRTAPTRIVSTAATGGAVEPDPVRPASGAGMPMMSPAMMGGLGGAGAAARARNRKLFPDEPVYVDSTPHSAAVIGARKRTPPKATPPAKKAAPSTQNAKGAE